MHEAKSAALALPIRVSPTPLPLYDSVRVLWPQRPRGEFQWVDAQNRVYWSKRGSLFCAAFLQSFYRGSLRYGPWGGLMAQV